MRGRVLVGHLVKLRGKRCGSNSDLDSDFLLGFGIVLAAELARTQPWLG